MLAMSDKYGIVEASLPGLADFARVSIADCQRALEALQAPDMFSRTQDEGGRRIEPVDGGWRLINHGKYRQKLHQDERKEYLKIKQREYRARHRQQASTDVDNVSDTDTVSTHTDPDPDPDQERVQHTRTSQSALAGTLPRDHLRHAWCSARGKCVPDFLHGEFCAAIGGDSASQRLKAFYEAVELGWPKGPIGDDPVKLWRAEFARTFPSVAPAERFSKASQVGKRGMQPMGIQKL